jgi:hypothetical protein
MCWNAGWNGSEDYEESWNGRMAVSMEKLQRNIVFLKKLKNEYVHNGVCNGTVFWQ